MLGSGKPAHVRAGLGDDDISGMSTNAGDGAHDFSMLRRDTPAAIDADAAHPDVEANYNAVAYNAF